MNYLKIKNWDKWQTYRKDRGTPPWIKVYRNAFSNHKWAELSDAEKGQVVSLWIYAADQDGKIPNDAKKLQKMCQLDKPPNLDKLKALGFLVGVVTSDGCQDDAKVAPSGCQRDAPEAEAETEAEAEADKTPLSGKPDSIVILRYLNKVCNRNFRLIPKHSKCINARIKEGYEAQDFVIVVDKMFKKWGKDGKMMEFLRPITLFGTKFDGYLNMPEGATGKETIHKKQTSMEAKRQVVDNWAGEGDGPYDESAIPSGITDIL